MSTPAPNPQLQRIVWTVLLVLIAGLFFAYVRQTLASSKTRSDRPLEVYHAIPEFELTERSGKRITPADLKGKIWVASFIFSRCPGMCNTLTLRLQELQEMVKRAPGVQLVSFSVDPEYDTPEVLTKYAQKYQASPERWWFLTGDLARIHELIRKTFLLAVEKNAPEKIPVEGEYLHSSKFVLVDEKGVVRGYYDGLEPENLPRLLNDIGVLMRESQK